MDVITAHEDYPGTVNDDSDVFVNLIYVDKEISIQFSWASNNIEPGERARARTKTVSETTSSRDGSGLVVVGGGGNISG